MLTGLNNRKLTVINRLLAKVLIAGSVFLLPVGNAFAAADLTGSSADFIAQDTARDTPAVATPYMDRGGAWDGANDVTAVGDTFTITVLNSELGLPVNDTAFDLQDIDVTVGAEFNLASTALNIVNNTGGSCPDITVGSASQSGTNITLSIDPGQNVGPGCSYDLSFGLTTTNAVAAGTHLVDYDISYTDNLTNPVTVPVAQTIDVNIGALTSLKTTAESNPADNTQVDFNVNIQNPGAGGLFDVSLTDLLGTGFDLASLTITPLTGAPAGSLISLTEYRFDYIDAGANFNVRVRATTDIPLSSTTCPTLSNTASLIDRTSIVVPNSSASIPFELGALLIDHRNSSRCELCGTETIRVRFRNISGVDIDNIVVTEDMLVSGLTIVAGTSEFNGTALAEPVQSGTEYTWTFPAGLAAPANSTVDLVFDVVYDTPPGIDEDLAKNDTTIIATADYELSCGIAQQQVTSTNNFITLNQPLPQVSKLVRNVDANQAAYAATTFGHVDDDVIWEVSIQNTGPVDLQSMELNDAVTGNFLIFYVCPDVASADLAASGAAPGICTFFAGGTQTINGFPMTGNFGDPGPNAVLAGNTETIYYVGKVTSDCGVETNNNDIAWGCNVNPPGSLISAAIFAGGTDDNAFATLSTEGNGALSAASVTHTVRGVDGGVEIGSRGVVSITVVNDTGGTIRDVVIDDVLPASYVVDNTFTPTFIFTPAYAVYGGQSDQIANNIDTLPANLLNNTTPRFTLTSDDTGDNPVVDVNLFRNGDSFTITFQIVLIDPVRFDVVADLDLPEEVSPGTDPVSTFNINNDLTITYDDTCNFSPNETYNENPQFPVDVEDLDVSISDGLFILTNDPGTPLDLNVDVTNNGGHVADDYTVFITLGVAMSEDGLPGICTLTSNLPPNPTWNDPAAISTNANVYACTPGPVAPGNTVRITIPVIKSAGAVPDDLTFRADVVGQIVLSDTTTLLTLPTPATIAKTAPTPAERQPANNYSFDAIRARVLGFNLVKSAWYCAENDPLILEPAPPGDMLSGGQGAPIIPFLTGDLFSQIGEDCAYRIESGGWFGFVTPGYTLIEVKNITVNDELPDGQGFIPFDDPASNFNYTSTGGIILNGVDGGAGSTPLDETDISWNFNAGATEGIKIADRFFRVDFKTRLLNDPVDLAYPVAGPNLPNLHGNPSPNVATTSFTAVFQSEPINGVAQPEINIDVSDTLNSPAVGYIVPPGYPAQTVREFELTDVEPNLIVTKTVCNESLSGSNGPACAPFLDAVVLGDTNDSYVYRITLTNETTAPVRSPAFNVIATDILDASDQMFIVDFANDFLDNNGDGSSANGDAGEILMYADISNNTINDGIRPIITLDESHGAPFAQIDSGATVTYYYRVDPDISIAPLQTLTNTVTMSYDSLDGPFGNQNDPTHDNSSPATSGRARIYTSIPQIAEVTMVPVISFPKIVVQKSNPTPSMGANEVSIGEEVRYTLIADLPVANLRQFTIRDELPFGVRCVEGQDVNLDEFPYNAAMFVPGSTAGTTPGICGTLPSGRDFIQWNFGDQAVTASLPGLRFNFAITFIARVENSNITAAGITLTNGGIPIDDPVTCTSVGGGGVGVCYVNDSLAAVSLDFAPVDIVVREPVILLDKSFLPVVNSDAADVLTVTVTAENTATEAVAYNLQVMDDLIGSDMTYIPGSVGGTHPPEFVDLSVPNRPVFSWDRVAFAPDNNYEILPGFANRKEFTFQVSVDTSAQPLERLDNTIEAKWDSLPGQDVALNHLIVPQGIGPDGSLLGLRNGAVANLGVAPNLYETTAAAFTDVLPLEMTKTDRTPAVVPTIGAHRNFEIIIDLPEGTTENLIVEDNLLVAAGVSYVLSRDGGLFDITYTFEDIVSIEGSTPDETVFRGAVAGPSTLPVDGDFGIITWDIGQVVTAEEDDLDGVANIVNPRIIINYHARPDNDAVTFNGVTMQNAVATTYDNGEDASQETLNATTVVQTVVEPLLAISKAVTNFSSPGVDPVAGDVLEYVVTIDNNGGTSTAFDSNIVDTLDDNLLFDATFTVTAILDASGSSIAGFVDAPTITAAPASTLTWGRLNSDNTLDIPQNSTLVLTYHAVVQNTIQPNVDIINSALVDWTSLDDSDTSSAFERTGDGCPNIIAPNNYCSAPALVIITADDSNSIVKTVIDDTWDNPLDSTVRIGDIVTYQLDVNIQQGITTSVRILDAIEPGMAFVDIISINGATTAPYISPGSGVGSNFSYAPIPATAVPVLDDRLSFDWDLGTITNDFAGDASTDTLIIIYRARVVDNDPATILQQPATTLTNAANLSYMDGNNSPPPPLEPRLNDTADVLVLQPLMDLLSKTDRSGRVSGDPVNVATDTMNFRLQTCNTTGLAPAYGLMVTDTLPTELDNTSLTVPVVTIGGTPASDGVDYIYQPPAAGAAGRGGDLVFTFISPVDPTACINIDFDIGFYTDFGFGSFNNQVDVNEYYSLPPADAQLYGPLGPELYIMNNPATAIPPPAKVKLSADEATIGEEVVYQITVPGVATGTILYDVTITDILDASQFYISAIDTGASGFIITDSVLPGNTVNLIIDQIPAGQQAIIELRARVDNNSFANAGISFNNSASYTYATSPGGTALNAGNDITLTALSITEPFVDVLKSVANTTQPGLPPDAGDILRYSITLTASGGAAAPADFFSDAFDVSLDDTLSLGLLFIDGSQGVDGLGNSIDLPVKNVADGITTAQTLSWSLSQANADIDVPEGPVNFVTVTYDVLVLDSVLADQDLSNSVDIQWSSRDGPNVPGGSGEFERDGSGLPLNDYFNLVSAVTLQTTPDNNTIIKTRLTDTFNPADNIVRIGDIVEYQLVINMQEGTSADFIVQDILDEGLVFEQTVSINGQAVAPYPAVSPFIHAAIPAAIVAGDPVTGPTTVSWTPGGDVLNPGDVINTGDNLANNNFIIIYRARVLNLALPQLPTSSPLNNNVDFDYTMASGAAPTKSSNQLLDLQQPVLAITKTSLPVDGSVIGAGDLVTYTVEIVNNGDSPAYDTELLDIIPFGLRSPAITMVSMQLLSGTPLPAILAPVYDPVTGTATWNFDTGTADAYNIPAGDTLQIVYQVQADAGLGTGLTLTNSAQVQFYYSFDNDALPSLGGINGVREIYGPTVIAQVDLLTTPAEALLKINPVDTDISIGETFTYRITVPAVTQSTALYDVRILDDLINDSAADLMFVGVAAVGVQPWTPVNIGTITDNLIIADITNGIDIPADTQIAVDVTVTLRNSLPPNDTTLTFSNAATYTFNQVDNDSGTVSNGLGSITPVIDVVEPDLTLLKTGPAGTVNFLAPIPYTVIVENIGDGPAYDTTIIDTLPAAPDNPPLTGGTCNATPTITSINIFENDGTTPAVRPAPALALGTDYSVTYTAAPSCELVIITLSDKARIEATEKLIITYETMLDVATQSGALLTNTAGATRWFSLDTAGAGATGEIREYTSVLTSSATVTVEAPVLNFQKTVVLQNDVNGDGIANPGDTLRYSIFIENTGPTALADFSLTDEVDGLAPASGFFAPGTMTNIVIPATADGINTDITGGANGAGLLDVRNLSIDEATGANPTVLIEFDITLLPVIDSNTIVLNQAQIDSPSTGILFSDYPVTPGANEPTPTPITSAPLFLVQKISTDITGDPAILQPGDTLRYTLTVKNIGQENSINSLLSDQVPANTTYVANSTRLNTVLLADAAAGISPLAAGLLINAPENNTAGFLRADIDPAANNVATITFDVVVSLTAVNGTVISNQGFFNGSGAGSGVFPQQPSDDPTTALVDDPTIDVVGNVPVIDALKVVALQIDLNSNGIVNPGDTLRYTITSFNIGALPATGTVLSDPLPNDTTYFANSTTLNGVAVPDVTAGVLPLILGIDINSSDLTPPAPLPLPGAGVLSAGQSAVVVFDVVVNAGTDGVIIRNQGLVTSNELPDELTDADGNNANGHQETVIVVGGAQLLAITKQVTVIGGGAALAGSELEYVVRVTNIGSITATNVVIRDDMDGPVPPVIANQKDYVNGSGLLDGVGLPAGSFVDPLLTVTIGDLPAAAVAELRFRVSLDAGLNIGDTVVNRAEVTWDAGSSAFADASVDIGGVPGTVNLSGQVWDDVDFNNEVGAGELLLQDYRVELYRNNTLLANILTDANGVFAFTGLPPNTVVDPYELRYLAPGATATTASLGKTNTVFSEGPQRITGIFSAAGTIVQDLNLPRQANGIIYDSVLRSAVAGVQLTMFNNNSTAALPADCFDDPSQQGQITLADGYYKFDLNFSDPSCPTPTIDPGVEYEIRVLPPASGFIGTTSAIIPPLTGSVLDVPNCPGNGALDKITATAEHCENNISNNQPPVTVDPRTAETEYHLIFKFDGIPVSQLPPPAPLNRETNQIYNNHIPVDSELGSVVGISKVAGKLNVVRSDLVPYTITFNNTLGVPLPDVTIIDNFPAGFKYVTGSARVDGLEIEPVINGRTLTWTGLGVDISGSRVIKLLLIVGSGVGEGEYVNTAQAINSLTGETVSGVASATVRVIPDPTFDCTDIIGKVYDDKNLNSYQDQGEMGIPGVQVATARGLRVTTDKHGRFHITCAIVANEVLGSNFIMKLDDRTLPSGYRVTTENPRVQRATRGKMMKFNFGTAVHRVVRLDLADGVFEKGSTELRPQWQSHIELLITELQKEGSILRLSYLGENETEDEVEDRLDAIEELVSDRWEELDCCYRLTIEQEMFWRKGRPSDRKEFE